jgi:predicted nuclease with RNAse H fold
MMKTAGVDLASKDADTATCIIEWSDGEATVSELIQNTGDATILELINSVDKVGIDVPLGWPIAFVDAVGHYSAGGWWPSEYVHADNESYRLRATDLWVKRNLEKMSPLSVSTNFIAIPAMRAAALLPDGFARDGCGLVVEVYPAVALRRWEFCWRGYKHKEHRAARETLVDDFLKKTERWLNVTEEDAELCRQSDDAFDALIAALVARAKACELTEPIPEEHCESARREGWIAVPRSDSLSRLASTEPRSDDVKC